MSDRKTKGMHRSAAPIQKNDIVTLRIEEINNLGCGVGHLPDGRVMFVRGTATGDELTAKVIKVAGSYLVGRPEHYTAVSPYRTDADCPAYPACGGCVYRHITYEHELAIKKNYVKNAFCKAGLPDVVVEDVRTTGQIVSYRNKAQYPVGNGADGMIAGFYADHTHRILPTDHCALQPPVFSEIVRAVCGFCDRYGIRAYDETNSTGLLRHIYLRQGTLSGQVLLCLVICGDTLPHANALCDELTAAFPALVGILLNHNLKNTNVVLGERYTRLYGKDTLRDTLCTLEFDIAPAAFYQVNHDAAELLYGIARERAALTGKETLLDLYCGIGTIGLSMADGCARLVGIEIVPEAVENAKENARRNGADNALFFRGDVGDDGDVSSLLSRAEAALGTLDVDVAIIDPPRKGTTPALIALLAQRQINRVVYVSCDVDTLARDCAIFRQHGYEIGTVTPVDLFPRTGHVESVVCLTRK
ncbi:MAG: 23S rRNA (uracil(1939)-C(5))-methyltransferase RlmD [Clostridia bacterium]|nr:23S rRNA (uracil(1939)-C(5))-methyltransferase RlmD [Clostridia bacterium]